MIFYINKAIYVLQEITVWWEKKVNKDNFNLRIFYDL